MFALTFGRGSVLAPGDGYVAFIPRFVLAAQSWASGRIPVWNPFAFSGYPLLAAQQAGVFYPPNALFLVFTPVVATNLVVLSSYAIAGLGAWLLARRLTGDLIGATVAGVAYGLSGFMVAHLGHTSMIATAAWLPWVLWSFDRLVERPAPTRFAVASVLLAIPFLAGSPQIALYIVLALAVYGSVVGFAFLRERGPRVLLLCGFLIVTGLCLAAVQVLPGYAVLDFTDRSTLTYESAMTYSLPASQVPMVLFPYLFGGAHFDPYAAPYSGLYNLTELTGYPGVVAVVLAVAGVARVRSDRRAFALLVMGVLAFLLAVPKATPMGRLFYNVPIYGQFRGWARYFLLFGLCVAVLAAYGVSELRQSDTRRRTAATKRALGGAVFVLLSATIIYVFPIFHIYRALPGDRPLFASLAVPAAFAGLAGLVVLITLSRRHWAAALVVVVGLDAVFSFGAFYEWRAVRADAREIQTHSSPSGYAWGSVRDTPGGIDRYAYVGDHGKLGADRADVTALSGTRSINGGDPLAPREYIDFLRMTQAGSIGDGTRLWRRGSHVLDVLRVSTVLAQLESEESPPDSLLPRGRLLRHEPPLVRFDREPALADALLVGEAQRESRDYVMASLYGDVPFDPSSAALVEVDCPSCPTGPTGPAGRVLSSERSLDTITVDVSADRDAFLVVSEAFWPGWFASVDGERVAALRTNGLVLGVPVPSGEHRIEFGYQPPGLRLGMLITILTLLAIGLAVTAELARRRNRVRVADSVATR